MLRRAAKTDVLVSVVFPLERKGLRMLHLGWVIKKKVEVLFEKVSLRTSMSRGGPNKGNGALPAAPVLVRECREFGVSREQWICRAHLVNKQHAV